MAARTMIDDGVAKAKYRYRVKNWAEYDRAFMGLGIEKVVARSGQKI